MTACRAKGHEGQIWLTWWPSLLQITVCMQPFCRSARFYRGGDVSPARCVQGQHGVRVQPKVKIEDEVGFAHRQLLMLTGISDIS